MRGSDGFCATILSCVDLGGMHGREDDNLLLRTRHCHVETPLAAYTIERPEIHREAPFFIRREAYGEEDYIRLVSLHVLQILHKICPVAFLAKELAISRSGLFAKVKELCGETPNNLINQARLNTAAKLLSEGKHTVGEICYMTGFSSPSYFSKCFLNQFGVPPHEWAQSHQG